MSTRRVRTERALASECSLMQSIVSSTTAELATGPPYLKTGPPVGALVATYFVLDEIEQLSYRVAHRVDVLNPHEHDVGVSVIIQSNTNELTESDSSTVTQPIAQPRTLQSHRPRRCCHRHWSGFGSPRTPACHRPPVAVQPHMPHLPGSAYVEVLPEAASTEQ